MTTLLTIKIFPKARVTRIIEFQNEILKISIKEPPEEQKANKALIHFLSEVLDIPKNKISILIGKTSKQKVLKVELSPELLKEKLMRFLS